MTRVVTLLGCAAIVACGTSKNQDKKEKPAVVSDAAPGVRAAATDASAKLGPRKIVLPNAPPVAPAPRGLPETPSPKYNPTTPEKVMLGKLLFFDKRLSAKRNMSCDSCHIPEYGWADRRPSSPTASGQPNSRHTPTLYNVAYVKNYRWDGMINLLEAFVLNHWRNQYVTIPRTVIRRLREIPAYRMHFWRSFKRKMTAKRAVEAISAFVRTIRSGNSPWDRYELDNDESAVSKQAIAGAKLFGDAAQCGLCHPPPHYMDNLFHNIGIGIATGSKDKGRFYVTKDDKHLHAFRTPTLRGIGRTAPYFHDGSGSTLANAVGYSLSGGFRTDNPSIDPHLQVIALTAGQKAELIEFVKALTPKAKPFMRPVLPPDPKKAPKN